MQEAMRSQDLQLSQIENLPGGFNALRRMYEDVQEPLMEATSRLNNQSSNLTQTPPSPQLTAPNTSALPNPWGATSSQPQANPMGGMGGGMPNPMGGMGGMNPAMMQQMMQRMGGGGVSLK
jgi:ubiquilin